jgi:hypothetical protein
MAKNIAGKCPPPDSDPFNGVEFVKNPDSLSSKKTAGRCDAQLYFHETVLDIAKARSRQR